MHHPTLMKNYGPPAFNAVRGEGVYLYDESGTRFLDFGSGIAVTSVGHSHPKWVKAVQDQAATLTHCSNLYGIPGQQKLADRIIEKAGPGRTLFCNSGAEANEALIKLARLHGRNLSGGEEDKRYTVVAAEHAFHGRTFGGMGATPQEKIQGGFRPMLDGFKFGQLNNIESFDKLVDDTVAAVFIESIQGEGGIFPAEDSFLQELRALCTERGALLMLDEVQCGIGRSGHFFAFEKSGVKPDAIGMAKGLGGGFPIGAIWVSEPYAELFQPGSHGTTFGGSPLACAAANATLDIIEEDNLLDEVATNSSIWHEGLQDLIKKHPQHIAGMRGAGYMVGLPLHADALAVTAAARAKGMLIVPAGHNTIRLLPALTATLKELAESVRILDEVFAELDS
ncbi:MULTISPECIES: aspartate aminotransferase family protein [unclassified Lentimonas]|uniref:aspartate aminotransferase family protein n=2 Tax=unclassified Lentimonas TaxID=2630993 RepID=UPI001325D2AF|nr:MULTISPECIES: acetylornithine transaminase [unclassified Lentimonas]CAA7169053.1 Acetylornithine aminotransferase (EC [Lentimonas sp. CC21]CAA7180539.1 Acetylornithine aminotransferase (EC [Lentimonas sp. CC8]CAA6678723.1 Acetylornithine aminotransferase (EC [Lentimonas sp. CC4]CAA6683709.1 Acetylornithine aminotransferase (EC [Lentimonas sp. CC6]CAA7074443.1 Acetylornithine aminotransferase (EC [Lentimonas sp. CC4]